MHRIAVPLVALSIAAVAVFPALANAVHEGKVVSVDNEENKIVVSIKGSDQQEFKVDEKCEITLNGKKAELDAIEEGATVKLTTKKMKNAEVVVKIEAKAAE